MSIMGFFLLCFSVYIVFWIFYNYNKNPVLPVHAPLSSPLPTRTIVLDLPVDTTSMIDNPILSKERSSSSSPKMSKKSSKSSKHSSSPKLSSTNKEKETETEKETKISINNPML